MHVKSCLIILLASVALGGCMPESAPAPAKRAPAPAPVAAAAPAAKPDTSEPLPAAAPRDGVEATSLPLTSTKGAPQRRVAAISSAPNPKPVAPIAPLAPSSTLDFPTLRARIMASPALGPMTKMAAGNALDDLTAAMNAHDQGHTQVTLARLRVSLDRLLDAIGGLVRSRDTDLFITMRDGRAALWASLSQPKTGPAPAPLPPPPPGPQTASTYDDLAGAIAVHGEACPYVSSFQRTTETDWLAHCAAGPVYRVYADAQDRIQVVGR
jgi:hypothetical protein